jgi:transcriptional regulator with PAS, ATPase and Fis domain
MNKSEVMEMCRMTDAGATTLNDMVRHYENNLIRQALITAQGRVTRAALLLGVSHQSLIYIMKSRHQDLLSIRTPIRPRKRSIVSKAP